MADWGLYTALRGTDDWQTKRADAMMNFQMMQGLAEKNKAENQERMEMEAKLVEYQEAMRNLDVLKQDQERVRGVEKTARQDIISGIAKYDGDVKRFMSSGGISVLGEYKRAIQESGEFNDAIENKKNMALYLQDRANDMWIRPVDFEEEVIDEKTGKKKKVKKKISMQDQIQMFEDGKISQINYAGGEKKIKLNPSMFKNAYKNANNPYSKDNYVSSNDIFNAAAMSGSKEQAAEIAQTYGKNLKESGNIENAWRWKAGDPTKLMELEQKQNQFEDMMDYRYWAAEEKFSAATGTGKYSSSGGGGLGDPSKTSIMAPVYTLGRDLMGGKGKTDNVDAQVTDPMLATKMANQMFEKRTEVTKLNDNYINSDYDYKGNVSMIGANGEIKNFPMGNLAMELGHIDESANFINKNGQMFMTATVYGAAGKRGTIYDDENDFTQFQESGDDNIVGAVRKYTDPLTEAEGYMAQVLIPITNIFEGNTSQIMDETIGLSRKYEGPQQTTTFNAVQRQNLMSGMYNDEIMSNAGGYNYTEANNSGMDLLK
jgi:hypothetical protein